MIKVLATKTFLSGAQLSKLEYTKGAVKIVFYVRENVERVEGLLTEHQKNVRFQFLEVCTAPEHVAEVVQIVELEDSVRRTVRPSPDFTAEWAEAHLSSDVPLDIPAPRVDT